MARAEVHPDIEPLEFLLGTWLGHGVGTYPTIEPFRYGEEVRFWHVGKAFLVYTQRTWALEDGRPLHSEMGFWRPQPDGGLEVVLSHPTGVVEVSTGTLRGVAIELETVQIGLTPTAKQIDKLKRSFLITNDMVTYEVRMAAVGQPLLAHVSAELHRETGLPGG